MSNGTVIEPPIGTADNEVDAGLRDGGHLHRYQFAVQVEPLAAERRPNFISAHV
jgi:hypothetical protein